MARFACRINHIKQETNRKEEKKEIHFYQSNQFSLWYVEGDCLKAQLTPKELTEKLAQGERDRITVIPTKMNACGRFYGRQRNQCLSSRLCHALQKCPRIATILHGPFPLAAHFRINNTHLPVSLQIKPPAHFGWQLKRQRGRILD